MNKIIIMGIGDVLQGDLGAGCFILEKMAETTSGKDIEYAYLARDTRYASAYLAGADLAVITGALTLSGVPGTLHVWDQAVFDQHAQWMARAYPLIYGLVPALARARILEAFPSRLVYIWIDPFTTEGYGLSSAMDKAVTRAVWQIHREIWKMRLNPASDPDRAGQAPCPALPEHHHHSCPGTPEGKTKRPTSGLTRGQTRRQTTNPKRRIIVSLNAPITLHH